MSPCTIHNVSRQSRCRRCGEKASGICKHRYRKRRCRVCCPAGYLAHLASVRIRAALKGSKNKKTLEYLGCDIQKYREFIEEQFEEGMRWDNHGKEWHIDHILSLYYDNPSEEEIIERLHYTNTQPMWAFENMSKGSRYIGKYNPDFSSRKKLKKNLLDEL